MCEKASCWREHRVGEGECEAAHDGPVEREPACDACGLLLVDDGDGGLWCPDETCREDEADDSDLELHSAAPEPEDIEGDAGDVDAMEAIEAQERDLAPLKKPNAAAVARAEEAAKKVGSNGGVIEMTYSDGSVATIPVPPAAARRLENRIASGDSVDAAKFRAEKWKNRTKRKAKVDGGACAECGHDIQAGDEYREGVPPPGDGSKRLISPRGAPYGKAHESCVVRLAGGAA
jgi:hypothetical protein